MLGRPDLPWPADMYLEGGDQYRGWFHSSLLVGVGLKGGAPYRECVTNGWTLDGEGRAMSKSLGNVIEPEKIIKQIGAEILRLWMASVEYNEDVRFSDTILATANGSVPKTPEYIPLCAGRARRFRSGHGRRCRRTRCWRVDQWILVRAEDLVRKCRAWYDEYAFHKVYRAVYDFATVSLSAVYFDMSKDSLYTAATGSRERRSAQTAMYRINYALVRLLAPLLAFTAEEVWSYMNKPAGDPDSVHLALFPEAGEVTAGLPAEADCAPSGVVAANGCTTRSVVGSGTSQAKERDWLRTRSEGDVVSERLGCTSPRALQERSARSIHRFAGSAFPRHEGLRVTVDRAEGAKCERCWKYTTDVGTRPDIHPSICAECADEVQRFVS